MSTAPTRPLITIDEIADATIDIGERWTLLIDQWELFAEFGLDLDDVTEVFTQLEPEALDKTEAQAAGLLIGLRLAERRAGYPAARQSAQLERIKAVFGAPEFDEIENEIQALRRVLCLALTAPSEAKAAECVAMAEELAAGQPDWVVEECKALALEDAGVAGATGADAAPTPAG